ncbi:MAG: tRNA(Arg) A34 adenosine deaminase TadA [Cellvibrionaceae bacterium]|jgi:tRNA(Arg) A34 adenosine deaminase TadA
MIYEKGLPMNNNDSKFIKSAIELARKARENGNHPFGALLVDAAGNILLEAENTVVTKNDCTRHAELNLMRTASNKYDGEFLATCTLYTSTEPCPMCAGAIFWGNVRRVVFGLSEEGLYSLIAKDDENVLYLPCRDIFKHGQKSIEVVGPVLEEEALKVHLGFWE